MVLSWVGAVHSDHLVQWVLWICYPRSRATPSLPLFRQSCMMAIHHLRISTRSITSHCEFWQPGHSDFWTLHDHGRACKPWRIPFFFFLQYRSRPLYDDGHNSESCVSTPCHLLGDRAHGPHLHHGYHRLNPSCRSRLRMSSPLIITERCSPCSDNVVNSVLAVTGVSLFHSWKYMDHLIEKKIHHVRGMPVLLLSYYQSRLSVTFVPPLGVLIGLYKL